MAADTPPAVLFDLDGTLVNSLQDIAESMNEVLMAHGHPVYPVDAYRTFVGNGLEVLVRRCVTAGLSQQHLDELMSAFHTAYKTQWQKNTRPYPGINQLLTDIRDANGLTGVISNKPESFTKAVVSHCFPDYPFWPVQGAEAGFPLKPAPDAGLACLQKWKRPADSVWYVGDTRTDMEFAAACGMKALGVTWGFRDRAELEAHGATAVVDHPADILDLILA